MANPGIWEEDNLEQLRKTEYHFSSTGYRLETSFVQEKQKALTLSHVGMTYICLDIPNSEFKPRVTAVTSTMSEEIAREPARLTVKSKDYLFLLNKCKETMRVTIKNFKFYFQ
jgi:hypothetical protein